MRSPETEVLSSPRTSRNFLIRGVYVINLADLCSGCLNRVGSLPSMSARHLYVNAHGVRDVPAATVTVCAACSLHIAAAEHHPRVASRTRLFAYSLGVECVLSWCSPSTTQCLCPRSPTQWHIQAATSENPGHSLLRTAFSLHFVHTQPYVRVV